jgi:hypothetical protein
MANIKKQWFPVYDSGVPERNDKNQPTGKFLAPFNVEARFSDHPVLNPEASKIARHAVYDWSIVLHTRVKHTADGTKALENVTSHTLRFDKGEKMGEQDFNKAKAAIMRCWDAWEHYQKFREAVVTTAEKMALDQINRSPLTAIGTVKVLKGGQLVDARRAGDDADEDNDDEEDMIPAVTVRSAKKPAAARKAKKTA